METVHLLVHAPWPPAASSLGDIMIKNNDLHRKRKRKRENSGGATEGQTGWGHGSLGSSISREYVKRCVGAVADQLEKSFPDAKIVLVPRKVSCTKDLDRYARINAPRSILFAFYFLWPTTFDDESSTTAAYSKGFVSAEKLFDLMEAHESMGCKTLFPHPVRLYRSITSKSWLVEASKDASLAVVPTTSVKRGNLNAANVKAAALKLKSSSGALIAKLGFSWEGLDVRKCTSSTLEQTAKSLMFQQGSRAKQVFVQPFLDAVAEYRVFVINGVVAHDYFAAYTSTLDDGTFCSFANIPESRIEAGGIDVSTVRSRGKYLAAKWYEWLQELQPSLPAIRIDFLLVSDDPDDCLVTLELTELGFSMWNWSQGPKVVFEALGNYAVKLVNNK